MCGCRGHQKIYGLPPLPPTSSARQTADGARRSIFDDFENFRNLSKIDFWTFLGVTGHAGIQEMSVFCVLVDLGFLENFDFLGFLGGLEILAGGYGTVLVGVSMM